MKLFLKSFLLIILACSCMLLCGCRGVTLNFGPEKKLKSSTYAFSMRGARVNNKNIFYLVPARKLFPPPYKTVSWFYILKAEGVEEAKKVIRRIDPDETLFIDSFSKLPKGMSQVSPEVIQELKEEFEIYRFESRYKGDASKHPLMNKNFKLIDYPTSEWEDGWMYIADVMAYMLKCNDELDLETFMENKVEFDLAIWRLKSAGYGWDLTPFVFISEDGKRILLNGGEVDSKKELFEDINRRLEDIRHLKCKKVLFVEEGNSFPEEIPEWMTKKKDIKFWTLDWRK